MRGVAFDGTPAGKADQPEHVHRFQAKLDPFAGGIKNDARPIFGDHNPWMIFGPKHVNFIAALRNCARHECPDSVFQRRQFFYCEPL